MTAIDIDDLRRLPAGLIVNVGDNREPIHFVKVDFDDWLPCDVGGTVWEYIERHLDTETVFSFLQPVK